MTRPGERFAKPISSRRYLSLRHGRRAIRLLEDGDSCDPAKEPPLEPGWQHLHSFFIPGLTAGEHTVTVTQDIFQAGQVPVLAKNQNPQSFSVLAPRFQLPDDAVYSVYPPAGNLATHDVLPHVLFNDNMLPWERVASEDAGKHNPPDYNSNRVPWLAVFAFTPDELTVPAEDLQAIFADTSLAKRKEPIKQTDSKAVSVPMSDLLKVGGKVAARPQFKTIDQATKPDADMIFLPYTLFNALFSAYKNDNTPTPSPTGGPDISRHRFLAHLREVNTESMAEAGKSEEKTQRSFSVVLSNRTGPLTAAPGSQGSQVIVHVVSLEGLEELRPFPFTEKDAIRRVGLISLHSWSYTCLPPDSLNVAESFDHLAKGMTMLRAKSEFKVPVGNTNPAANRMMARLSDGFVLTRYHPPTGEETAAIMRGPLTPTIVPTLKWDLLSNSGSSLGILDKELGLMDISYSLAWSLGRTLALADRAYTAALTRLRRLIINESGIVAQSAVLNAAGTRYQTKEQLIQSFSQHLQELVEVSRDGLQPSSAVADDDGPRRWKQPETNPPDLSYGAEGVAHFIDPALEEAAYRVAQTSDPPPDWWKKEYNYEKPYDEFNTPMSADWALVLRFVLDLYHLINIPSHYLLTDPGHLPTESFRLFFVDHNWVDALVDGALSLGNHGQLNNPDEKSNVSDDPVRRAIKMAINRYLDSKTTCRYKPPIPRFGYYMRSAVVTAFPDLRFDCRPDRNQRNAPMMLRHEVVDNDVILGFFSDQSINAPGGEHGLQWLQFTVPAHQQYFSCGVLNAESFKALYKRQYTVKNPDDEDQNKPIAKIEWKRSEGGKGTREKDTTNPGDTRVRDPIFIWGTDSTSNDIRMLLVEKLAEDVYQTLLADMKILHPTWFVEKCATSAVTSVQLNSPAYQLRIGDLKALIGLNERMKLNEISPLLSFRPGKIRAAHHGIARHALKTLTAPIPQQGIGLTLQQVPPHFRRIHIEHGSPESRKPSSKKMRNQNACKVSRTEREYDESESENDAESSVMTPDTWSVVSSSDSHAIADWEEEMQGRMSPIINDTFPEFNYSVRPSLRPDSKDKIPIQKERQDIIFSIVYRSGADTFEMTSMNVSIPVKPIIGNGLMDVLPSSSSGASMVSNLRFNVRSVFSQKDHALKLEITPRSTTKKVLMEKWRGQYVDDFPSNPEIPFQDRTELSVILYGVHVALYNEPTDVKITFQPSYEAIGLVNSTDVHVTLG